MQRAFGDPRRQLAVCAHLRYQFGVGDANFSDAALMIVGHGSTVNAGSSAPVYQHAAELRRRKIFAEVREAFWKQEPRLNDVLAGLAAPRIFIAPLFISEGYFSEQIIPRELGFRAENGRDFGRVLRREGQTLFYCRPVGTHDSMTSVLLARAREIVEKFPFPRAPMPQDITLFVAGHGTEQDENSRAAIERQVDLIRARNVYADVHGIFMEEEPRIAQCYGLARTKNLVVVPFFISDGMHVREDIPVLLGEPERLVRQRLQQGQSTWRNPTERAGKRVWYAPSVGTEPHLADVILARVAEIAGRESLE
jgi:sirohydrochlorin cobaltochelatase